MGNLHSVYVQCKRVGFEPLISSKPSDIENADKLILPGVGHFSKGMEKLKELNLIEVLSENMKTTSFVPHSSVSLDGNTLYFASAREGGYGGADLYSLLN